MSTIQIRGRVQYMPGPWGSARPAAGVALTIVDEDRGNAGDTIWTGTTDAQGHYSGTTREWRDSRTVTVATPQGRRSMQVADATDVMMLKATASQRQGTRMHSITVPFVPAPQGLPQAPIVLGWGPPALSRVWVDGVPVNKVSEFSRLIKNVFDGGVGIARGAVFHEVRLVGEEVAMLRGALTALGPELRAIEAQILPLLRRDLGQQRPGLGHTQGTLLANSARAVIGGAAAGRVAASGLPPGPDPWAPVRQRLMALTGLLEQQLRRQASLRDQMDDSRFVLLCAAVMRAIADAIVGIVGPGSMGSGGLLLVAVVASLVTVAVTVVQNIPAIMMMLGFSELAEASALVGDFLDQNSVASALYIILIVCALIIMTATAPADGWTWFIEHIIGENGLPGLRFVYSR